MRNFMLTLLASLAFTSTVFSADAAPVNAGNKTCICGHPVDAKLTATVGNKVYGVCSEECKKKAEKMDAKECEALFKAKNAEKKDADKK